uniref:Uncharacterized protein n=1 Tax=Daphnia galeata TaxID=27404 RepID=A0A8J2RAI9_9CRUS|nr:unnamed protein product [Daphnia galeata]
MDRSVYGEGDTSPYGVNYNPFRLTKKDTPAPGYTKRNLAFLSSPNEKEEEEKKIWFGDVSELVDRIGCRIGPCLLRKFVLFFCPLYISVFIRMSNVLNGWCSCTKGNQSRSSVGMETLIQLHANTTAA